LRVHFREELFVTSKLWNTNHDPALVRAGIEETLKQLGLSYLDLYLIHWPQGYAHVGDDLFPKNEAGEQLHTNFDLSETWKAMEALVDAGLTKSIGLSNFNARQVDKIVGSARIQPVTNQIELHPFWLQKKIAAHCRSKNIVITAYSPLGSPANPWVKEDDRVLLNEPKLHEIAKKYNKTPAQILIRYQMDIGNIVIPKSVTKARIVGNFEVFDFKLTAEDIATLENFGFQERICTMDWDLKAAEYPFHEEY